jgi:hypothetical protein
MRVKRYVIASAAVLAVGAGTGAAIAATSGDDGKKAEQSILDDAAKRLNVSPDDLRSALGAAEDAQLDQAVKDGKLTQAQADAIKARRKQDGRVLGLGPGGPHGPGFGFGPGHRGLAFGPRGAALGAAADALGITRAQLLSNLADGKSIADVAKNQNKNLDDVKAAIKDAVTKELDADVKAGRLTDAQRKDILAELDDHLDDLVNLAPPRFDRDHPGAPRLHWR